MTHTYHAASLAELAELFDTMASRSNTRFGFMPQTKQAKAFAEGQQSAWRAAAEVLRQTVITANGNVKPQ